MLRVALAFGLTSSAVFVLVAATGDNTTSSVVFSVAWLGFWASAFAHPRLISRLLRQHTWSFSIGLGIASAISVVATGGFGSVTTAAVNWIVWAATVVLGARAVFSIAAILSASHLIAFALAGLTTEQLTTSADRYMLITDVMNPFVIALAGLALVGVFRSLMSRLPELLMHFRSGGGRFALPGGGSVDVPALPLAEAPPPHNHPNELLSPAEQKIVNELAAGKKPKQMAFESGRSVHTIYDHIANAKRKTGSRNTAQLVSRAWIAQN